MQIHKIGCAFGHVALLQKESVTALSVEPQRNSVVNVGWLCGYALFSFGCEPPTLSLFVSVTFWGLPVTPVPVLNSPRGLEAESEGLGQTLRMRRTPKGRYSL